MAELVNRFLDGGARRMETPRLAHEDDLRFRQGVEEFNIHLYARDRTAA